MASPRADAGAAPLWRTLGAGALAYLCWATGSVLGLGVIVLARAFLALLARLSTVLATGPWLLGAMDKLGVLVLGVCWLAWMVYAEHRYREAITGGATAVLRRALRLHLPPAVALLALAGATALLPLLVSRP